MQSGSEGLCYILHKCSIKNNSLKVSPVSCPHIPAVSNNLPHSYIYIYIYLYCISFGYIISCHHLPMIHEGPVGYCLHLTNYRPRLREVRPPTRHHPVLNAAGPQLCFGTPGSSDPPGLTLHWLGAMWVVKPKRPLCRLRFLTVTTLKDITEKGLPYNLGLSWINEKTFKRQWENSLFSEAVAFHCLAKVIILIWPTLVWARDDSPGWFSG